MHYKNYITHNYSFIQINFMCNLMLTYIVCIKTKSPINCLVELKNNCNKITNEISSIH